MLRASKEVAASRGSIYDYRPHGAPLERFGDTCALSIDMEDFYRTGFTIALTIRSVDPIRSLDLFAQLRDRGRKPRPYDSRLFRNLYQVTLFQNQS